MTSIEELIVDDLPLLSLMMQDAAGQSGIYAAGPYWAEKSRIAAKQIEEHGLENFRGSSNAIGISYAGAADWDIRLQLPYGLRAGALKSLLSKKAYLGGLLPNYVSMMFDSQVSQTESIWRASLELRNHYLSRDSAVADLLARYTLSDTIRGGCLDFMTINGSSISYRYLELLLTHDFLSKNVDFSLYNSYFEIGGGFGAYVHILVNNHPNLKKIIYLDIPPNLYVGTQYLKSLFGESVRDYRNTRMDEKITFADNDALEILCIAPWQIERLDVSVDIFHNGNSFVEMPVDAVSNYVQHVERLLSKVRSVVTLVSYDKHDPSTTFSPAKLPEFFKREFEPFEHATLAPNRHDLHYISLS